MRALTILSGFLHRLAALDLVDVLHALGDLAPDRVLAVEEGGVVEADEELAVGGIRAGRARHRGGAAHMRLLVELGLELLAGAAGAGALRAAGLRHEALDHAMEHDAVVKAFPHQFLDPRDMAGRQVGPHLDGDGPLGGFEDQSIFGDSHARLLYGLGLRFAVVELDGEGPACGGAAHAVGKWHRRAALQRLHDGDAVKQPVIIGGLFQFIGDFRMAQDIAGAIETHQHGDSIAALAVVAAAGRQQPTVLEMSTWSAFGHGDRPGPRLDNIAPPSNISSAADKPGRAIRAASAPFRFT